MKEKKISSNIQRTGRKSARKNHRKGSFNRWFLILQQKIDSLSGFVMKKYQKSMFATFSSSEQAGNIRLQTPEPRSEQTTIIRSSHILVQEIATPRNLIFLSDNSNQDSFSRKNIS